MRRKKQMSWLATGGVSLMNRNKNRNKQKLCMWWICKMCFFLIHVS